MISKQQRRLLFLFILAFGLLTVPVILVLIKLVPPDEARAVSTVVVQDRATAVTPGNKLLPSESNTVTDNSKTVSNEMDLDQTTLKPDVINDAPMQRAFIAGNWVVVDCGRRIVLQCPHRFLNTSTSPRFGKANKVFQSHCRDVSIKLDSFCKL